ncbi:MAG TPA: hypothetical protein VKQ30_16225 [Ktedonobacterales bacterium]|nr:hypothetical protein [Ktedonobacterales bacterium]
MILADLHPRLRRHKVQEALAAALRQIEGPTSTSDLVKRIAVILGTPKETTAIARLVGELAPEHPSARETGETFQKYGRTMRRREWLPSHAKRTSKSRVELDPDELARRRAVIASHAEADQWTVQPGEPEFLED